MFETSDIITICVLVCGFIAQAAYLKGTFSTRIKNNEDDIGEIKEDIIGFKKSVRYEDTCDSTTKGFDKRISNLEKVRNSTAG